MLTNIIFSTNYFIFLRSSNRWWVVAAILTPILNIYRSQYKFLKHRHKLQNDIPIEEGIYFTKHKIHYKTENVSQLEGFSGFKPVGF